MEAYWFVVGLLGFMVNLLLLLSASQLSGHSPDWRRLLIAGLTGGIHAGCCVFDGLSFLSDIHWRLISVILLCITAFSWDASGVKCGAVYFLMRMALDELAGGGIWPALLFAVLIMLLCSFRGFVGENYAKVTMEHKGKRVEVTALVDTGNTLIDPISGMRVIVVGCDVASSLLGLDRSALEKPSETICSHPVPGFRLIPYTAIGVPSGMLLGLRVDNLLIDGKSSDSIVAFAPQTIGQGKQFQALAGGNI